MKKRIINLMAALFLASTAVFASNNPSVVVENTSTAMTIDAKAWKSELIKVEITNEDGKLVYNKALQMDNAKKFYFQELLDGVYSVKLSDDLRTSTYKFEISDNNIELVSDISTVYKPSIEISEEYIDVNYMNIGRQTTIELFDTYNQVFRKKYKGDNAINARFDLSELPEGKYRIYVNSGTESYWKSFKI